MLFKLIEYNNCFKILHLYALKKSFRMFQTNGKYEETARQKIINIERTNSRKSDWIHRTKKMAVYLTVDGLRVLLPLSVCIC